MDGERGRANVCAKISRPTAARKRESPGNANEGESAEAPSPSLPPTTAAGRRPSSLLDDHFSMHAGRRMRQAVVVVRARGGTPAKVTV